jgi:hypothetical protein
MNRAETENVIAILDPAPSDVLVVTFAHMDFDPTSGRFWGQDAIKKGGFAGLGLVCRSNCWYPTSDMLRLKEFVRNCSLPYQRVVFYGFSMGGYAALKFSSMLGSHSSIALSPQYSINPADVWHHDRRLLKHFRESLNSEMAITETDLGGHSYVYYDPYSVEDKWNCEMISERAASAQSFHHMPVPWIGHETIDVFAGSSILFDLVTNTLTGDIHALRIMTSALRRQAQRRMFNTLSKLRERSPERAVSLYSRYGASLSSYWQERWLRDSGPTF